MKMKQYSSEFEAGQVGMILVNANVSGDFNDAEQSTMIRLRFYRKSTISRGNSTRLKTQRLVSVVFLMKSSGVQVTVSGQDVNELLQLVPCGGNQQCEDVKTTADVLLNQSQSLDASFWDLLNDPMHSDCRRLSKAKFSCSTCSMLH